MNIRLINLNRSRLVSLLIGIASITLGPAHLHAWQADLGNGTYKNPILFADYSDPDVLRVGSAFYMVSSSFQLMPGIPILKSGDLVNWTIIGHAYPRLNIHPAYDMKNGNRYGRGAWAPAIRYHNHRFYIYFPTPDEGIFMTSAPAAEGPWDPIVPVIAKAGLEDPCPFWDDDGTAYLIHSTYGAGPLILHKMSPDGKSVLDAGKLIVQDRNNLLGLEGPKLYKRNGYYYIFAPCWGVGNGAQAVLRSRNIYGPYDYKIVLAQGSTDINGPHQGGYVETPSGQGWFLHFHSHGGYGRITCLEPVTWTDDWPVMGDKNPSDKQGWAPKVPDPDAVIGRGVPGPVGQPVLTHAKPDVPACAIQVPQTSDDFSTPQLGLQWEWNHNPVDDHWSLTERPGFLRLKSLPAPDLVKARNTLTQMLGDLALEATTLLDTNGMTDNQKAGLCVLCDNATWIGVAQDHNQRHIVLHASKTDLLGPALSQDTIQLRVTIRADQTASYSYSLDGSKFTSLGSPARFEFGWWKAARLGLFTFNSDLSTTPSGSADFDWFHYQPSPLSK